MFQWYIFAMFGMAIPRSMAINMSLSTRGVTHWWIVSRWSQKNIVTDDMVQIRKKKQVPNVLYEKCWDFFKSSKNNIPSNSPEINKNPSYPQILITVDPLLNRETLFWFFHATGNPLVESTSNRSLFIYTGVCFFFCRTQLGNFRTQSWKNVDWNE